MPIVLYFQVQRVKRQKPSSIKYKLFPVNFSNSVLTGVPTISNQFGAISTTSPVSPGLNYLNLTIFVFIGGAPKLGIELISMDANFPLNKMDYVS